MNPSTNSSILIARPEVIEPYLERLGLANERRPEPELVKHYVVEQFGAWKVRKEANNEPHADAIAGFEKLPPEVQQMVARLAEARLIALKTCLTPEALGQYNGLGKNFSDLISQHFGGQTASALDALKIELSKQAANGEQLRLSSIEHAFLPSSGKSVIGGNFASASDVLLRIHHGLWHANLEKPHEFAYRQDDLPTEPVDHEDATKKRPHGLRAFSDQANLLGIVGQMIALNNSLIAVGFDSYLELPELGFTACVFPSEPTSMLKPGAEEIIRNLDAKAIINNA